MLLKRILTAIILIPLLLSAIIWMPPFYFSLMTAAFMLVGAWEWSGLIGFSKHYFKIIYVVCVGLGMACVFPGAPLVKLVFLFIASFIWLWAFIAIINYQRNGSGAGFQIPVLRALIGLIVLVATGVSIVTLKTSPYFGPAWLILVLLIIWGADIGGFFAGRFFGKHALCSRVSPKKTWEGFVGGILLSEIIAAVTGLVLSFPFERYMSLFLLTLITALFSVVGDLGVSLLKRMSNIKDSGKIFPGHGGMLDRLDSVAAATVVFVIVAILFRF